MINSIKKVLVIGASGLVGKTLVLQLNALDSCEEIDVIVRREQLAFLSQKKIQQIVLDDFLLLNYEQMQGYSHVFSCLGSTLKQAGSKQAFYNVDYKINAHIANLVRYTPTHLLVLSSMNANADSVFFYAKVKGQLEDYLKNLNLYRLSIIQPSLLQGQRDEARFLEDLAQKIYQKMVDYLPQHFRYRPVTASQVAHTMVEAAQNQQKSCETYANLCIQKH